MRIALLYPPPWKMAASGEIADFGPDGPPRDFRDGDIDVDFHQMPYGLLSLAAQAMRAGHQVKVLNLSSVPWVEVERVLGALEADLYGLSCFTANRRGVELVARLLRQHHDRAHIAVGGPHVTALPIETLAHWDAVDTVVLGEGEHSFMELVERLEEGRSTEGIAGTAHRQKGKPTLAPARARIADLDELASPHDYFDTHLLLTARGCPGRCSFCATRVAWGRGYRALSAEAVLDAIDRALARLPVKMLMVKDETFTADRKRGLAICRGIQERGQRFIWSCDTRADALDEELVREMRLAGCQRLSLGVESGSIAVLKNIGKRITPEGVIQTTELAKRYGLEVRFFMMLGNRGETADTLRQSLELIQAARPHQYIFACLSIYPGTADYRDWELAGRIDAEVFFTEDFQELKAPFDASDEVTALLSQWFEENAGLHDLYRPGIADCQAVLERLGDHHAAHMDLGAAYYAAGDLEGAERHVHRALELGYPLLGLAYNTLACIAAEEEDWSQMQIYLGRALLDPLHDVVQHNSLTVRQWLARGGPESGTPPRLVTGSGFRLLEPTHQPMLPGPLPEDVCSWG